MRSRKGSRGRTGRSAEYVPLSRALASSFAKAASSTKGLRSSIEIFTKSMEDLATQNQCQTCQRIWSSARRRVSRASRLSSSTARGG